MSLFKKPKKNIRRRVIETIEDDEVGEGNESKMEIDEEENVDAKANIAIAKMKKKERRKQAILSFDEDLDEGDDGEVFQVKKSSQSKKMMKLLDRERKKRKEVHKDGNSELVEDTDSLDLDKEKNSIEMEATKQPDRPTVLNGREAEMAVCDPESDDDGSETHHKFSRPDHVKLLLESGRIPDAATIHAARKRRQLAREMGDFISIQTTAKPEGKTSRLVRDDDQDASGDEERITMEVNLADRERDKRREAFLAAQDKGSSEESDKGEDDEWESQQIRKGVTGAQLAAVQQETLYQQFTMSLEAPLTDMPQVAAPLMVPGAVPTHPLYTIGEPKACTPEIIANRLRERITSLKEGHERHVGDRSRVAADLVATHQDITRLESEGPKLAERFRYYQELRGYVTDLVECLDEKVSIVTALEQRVLHLVKRRSDDLVERRRQDVRDQAEELTPISRPGIGITPKKIRDGEEARVRRAAEREGRRTRRRRARELKGIMHHVDGMSSDDEMTELEAAAFRNQKDVIESDARVVFNDVVDEFCTVRGVLKRFENWRVTDPEAYREAYVSLCLPKVLGPLIRLKMVAWLPLQEGANEIERHKWYDSLLLYGLQESETEETLRYDPDLQLIPLVIEKVLLPKLTDMVEAYWDPVSTSQTLRLVGLVNRLLHEYPTLGPDSKTLRTFLSTVVEKMRQAVENDVFIPIYPRHVLESRGGSLGVFFQRQFGCAVKLLRNLLSWQGVVSDEALRGVALGSLLNRYLLAALRACDPVDAASKCTMIVSTFPRWWFQQDSTVPQLSMFTNQLRVISQGLDVTAPAGREAAEQISRILQTLQSSCPPL